MKHSIKIGFSFGLTSGIITTLGLMVGLHSGTHSRLAVVGGVLTIAIADAFSDALGIHISEESEIKHTEKEIWISTISTFLSKLIFASSFLIPVILLPLSSAVVVSILWGFLLLGVFSYYLGRAQRIFPLRVMFEHWLTAGVVILLSQLVGICISNLK
ncbi:MAG TPA: hypothetical protein ENG39_03235 [Candidatus Omnitrophica bacterium]|nr:hypothetical protein [Candidatus Omnitrophota bacterium]